MRLLDMGNSEDSGKFESDVSTRQQAFDILTAETENLHRLTSSTLTTFSRVPMTALRHQHIHVRGVSKALTGGAEQYNSRTM